MAQTCALIAPVQPILHRVSCRYETLPSTPKHYETHQNMSLGSNWLDRVRSLQKIPMRLHATNLCSNSTISANFASNSCINKRIQNAPKHYKMHQNMRLQSNGWIGFVCCQKFRCDFVARTFALIAPVQPVLHRVSCSNETIQKCTQILQNAPIQELRF